MNKPLILGKEITREEIKCGICHQEKVFQNIITDEFKIMPICSNCLLEQQNINNK